MKTAEGIIVVNTSRGRSRRTGAGFAFKCQLGGHHTFRRHTSFKCGQNVLYEASTFFVIHPESVAERIVNVNSDEDLRPVLDVLVNCQQEIGRQYRNSVRTLAFHHRRRRGLFLQKVAEGFEHNFVLEVTTIESEIMKPMGRVESFRQDSERLQWSRLLRKLTFLPEGQKAWPD